ncbi:hypothetical protein ACFWNK_01890 [Streptomyces sp. NPDC058417]
MLLLGLFVLAVVGGFIGLCLVDLRTVPPICGTCALILTCAALGVAVLR